MRPGAPVVTACAQLEWRVVWMCTARGQSEGDERERATPFVSIYGVPLARLGIALRCSLGEGRKRAKEKRKGRT